MKQTTRSVLYHGHPMNLFAVAIVISASACVLAEADQTELSQTEQYALPPKCDDWGCGMNTPHFEQYGFYRIPKNGAPNEDGYAIYGGMMVKNNVAYLLNVTNGRITGTNPSYPVLQNQALIGARMYIMHNGVFEYFVRIQGVERIPSWAAIGVRRFMVDTYLLEWSLNNETFENLCTTTNVPEPLGMNTSHTLVFEGDRIDSETKTVA